MNFSRLESTIPPRLTGRRSLSERKLRITGVLYDYERRVFEFARKLHFQYWPRTPQCCRRRPPFGPFSRRVRGGGRGRHFGGPVGATPLMPGGGRVAQGAAPNYCNRQSIRYEFFEAWADLSIRCWIGRRVYRSDGVLQSPRRRGWERERKIFLDSRWHFEDHKNNSCGLRDRSRGCRRQPNKPTPRVMWPGVHRVTAPLAPSYLP